ncbi:hypothetical protein HAX54_023818 [Datura stramonium]|uniref:Uncharacterized protein n=1 Tax=Datura stramonium TaxID=4076 RepID=A0ABS8UX97_DATST|nr:hypothetical protein [Datura stramonium]
MKMTGGTTKGMDQAQKQEEEWIVTKVLNLLVDTIDAQGRCKDQFCIEGVAINITQNTSNVSTHRLDDWQIATAKSIAKSTIRSPLALRIGSPNSFNVLEGQNMNQATTSLTIQVDQGSKWGDEVFVPPLLPQ